MVSLVSLVLAMVLVEVQAASVLRRWRGDVGGGAGELDVELSMFRYYMLILYYIYIIK